MERKKGSREERVEIKISEKEWKERGRIRRGRERVWRLLTQTVESPKEGRRGRGRTERLR